MKQYIGRVLLVGTITVTFGCATSTNTQKPTNKYHATIVKNQYSVNSLRYQGLREASLSLGARAGLAWRAQQINQIVARHERNLDLVFNFNSLMLDKHVLPPVLIEGRQNLDQTADDIIRISDRAYSIQSQARFVTVPPTWRDYLKMNYKEPDIPDSSLMPRTDSEKKVWDRYVDEGWQAGISQADVIFAENLGRLKRDFDGMIRYRVLLAQNMVSKPYVAQVNMGVTGGDSQMAINDRVLRITALPEFNISSQEWNAVITPHDRQPAPDDSRPLS